MKFYGIVKQAKVKACIPVINSPSAAADVAAVMSLVLLVDIVARSVVISRLLYPCRWALALRQKKGKVRKDGGLLP